MNPDDVEMEDTAESNSDPLVESVPEDGMEGTAITEVPAPNEEEMSDPYTGHYTWSISLDSEDWRASPKIYSEEFEIGGYFWRMLVFPKGNRQQNLALYLDAPDAEGLPQSASPSAKFKLTLLNQNPANNMEKETNHTFSSKETDWGFTSFCTLDEVNRPDSGFIHEDNSLRVRVDVQVVQPEKYAYDSRSETGYVGLKNQGATCYMNSVLQTLYHIPYFRKAVYHMPTEETAEASSSIPVALQSLFFKLQYSPYPVSTKDLTKSFGWTTYDAFMQHDVQELNRVLCEKLEEKMKGTKVERVISELFEGHMYNYIECVDIEYKSTRTESFMDIQLDVKGCPNVYASFDKYVEVEMLDGDNKYKAEGHGLQDARKGVLFKDFPPVLQLQLKRFEYDIESDAMVKINDRYEFPDVLDLDKDDGKYLAPDADRSVCNKYYLHSVLVHSGSIHGGHYYNFTRPGGPPGPGGSSPLFKFDDERVSREEPSALAAEYGGEDESPPPHPSYNNMQSLKFTKYSSAYMLVYIRASDRTRVMCDVGRDDIAEHLRSRLDMEQKAKERRRREKKEAHLYTVIRVSREADFHAQVGRGDQYFDLMEPSRATPFRVRKNVPLGQWKREAAASLGVDADTMRLWMWQSRENSTFRVGDLVTSKFDNQPIRTLYNHYVRGSALTTGFIDLFLEESPKPGQALPMVPAGGALVFMKHYDPVHGKLSYAGKVVLSPEVPLVALHKLMRQREGLPENTPLLVVEEIKSEPHVMVEAITEKQCARDAQLETGDILIFQQHPGSRDASAVASSGRPPFAHAADFLSYVRNRRMVDFRKLEEPKAAGITVECSRTDSLAAVNKKLAAALSPAADPARLRLTCHNTYSAQPQRCHVRSSAAERLEALLTHHGQSTDILYYERLDIPLVELENLKTLRVFFHAADASLHSEHALRLPLDRTAGDALSALRDALPEGTMPRGAPMRMFEVYQSKIYKSIGADDAIERIDDKYWQLRAEVTPPEELAMQPDAGDVIIQVCHFCRDKNKIPQPFGHPFLLPISVQTTLADAKRAIAAKLKPDADDYASWAFAAVTQSNLVEPLDDGDVLVERMGKQPSSASQQSPDFTFLGMEHVDKNPAARARYRCTPYDKPIKIYN